MVVLNGYTSSVYFVSLVKCGLNEEHVAKSCTKIYTVTACAEMFRINTYVYCVCIYKLPKLYDVHMWSNLKYKDLLEGRKGFTLLVG